MKVLYELIHERAHRTWEGAILLDNYEAWASHWVETAIIIKAEFVKEGLTDTAEEIDKIIRYQVKYKPSKPDVWEKD